MEDNSSESAAGPEQGAPVGQVIRIDEERIRGHLDRIARGSVEETLKRFSMRRPIGRSAGRGGPL